MPSITQPLPPNRTMPPCTIIPVLGYSNVSEAIDWLCETFGFTERWRVGNHRAQLMFDSGAIVVTERKTKSAEATENNNTSMMVRVRYVDGHYEHVRQHGASIVSAPTDYPYGERQYTVKDLAGHTWTFSQSVQDLAPEDWGGRTKT